MDLPVLLPSARREQTRRTAAVLLLVVVLASSCSSGDIEVRFTDPPDTPAGLDGTTSAPDDAPVATSTTTTTTPSVIENTDPGAIRVDQFGYRTSDPKVAVLVDPEVGHDAGIDYEPGEQLEVRRWSDDTAVFAGTPVAWADGAVHAQSGDRGWWFDFSPVSEPGSYYIIDPASDEKTGRFEIADDVYDDLLDAALKMFWYNRGNTAHPESIGGPWNDDPAYVGAQQDTEARWVDDPSNPETALDLSGGWFDAGDTNKYVTFAIEPVHLLLSAFSNQPAVFDDDVGIPESGNGIPDIIDEVRWEISWLEKMQQADGGMLLKVGLTGGGEGPVPSVNTLPRYYEEACSSSTIAAAGMFAHAAVVFATVPELADEAPRLQERAVSAWDWYAASEKRDDCDPQIVRAGDADMSVEEQQDQAVVAAIYLFSLTGDPRYDAVVRAGHRETLPFKDDGFGRYGPDQSDALLFYRGLPDADSSTVRAIDGRVRSLLEDSSTHGFDPAADLYRAFMPDEQYHWGSNMVKANVGSANLVVPGASEGAERALGHLQYLHGVNPLGMVYLTNMADYGAELSAERLFHYWFGERSAFDVDAGSDIGVPPGFLVGGPNRFYSGGATPPAAQPPMKSYRDWSAYGSEPTWELSEPAIYYQAAYVRLLSVVIAS
jgi:endoglucanase